MQIKRAESVGGVKPGGDRFANTQRVCNELPSLHSITSSARARDSRSGGIRALPCREQREQYSDLALVVTSSRSEARLVRRAKWHAHCRSVGYA